MYPVLHRETMKNRVWGEVLGTVRSTVKVMISIRRDP